MPDYGPRMSAARPSRARDDGRWRSALPALVVLASVLVGACGGDDGGEARGATTTIDRSTTSSTSAPDPTSPTAETLPPGHEQPADVVFPDAATSRRFDDPVAVARAFAADWVGFTDPDVGEARTVEDGSAEVDVRPTATGPVTTVSTRRLDGDGTWWVTGASTPALQLQDPAAGDEVAPPLEVGGQSTAYEGTVDVELRADGQDTPLVQGFVNGGANGQMGPFAGTFPFDPAGSGAGSVVLSTRGGEDGRIWEATVVRVRLSPTS